MLPPFLLLAACARPEPAPTNLDALAHFFLAQGEIQDHDRIVEGGRNLVAWFQAAGLDGTPSGGTLSDLTREEALAVSDLSWDADPEPCAGVYEVALSPCTMEQAAAVNLVEDQSLLFPDHYETYHRTWGNDPSCWEDGCDAVDWVSDVVEEVSGGIATLTYRFVVRMRQSREDGDPSVLLLRTVLPEPAVVDTSAATFEQSYHAEVFVPYGEGTLHLYALWNAISLLGGDTDGSFWSNQYVEGLADYEAELVGACALH